MPVCRLDPRRRSVITAQLPIGWRQLGVPQAPRSMDCTIGDCGRVQRAIGAFGHRHTVDAAQLKQAEVVLADLFYPNVSPVEAIPISSASGVANR